MLKVNILHTGALVGGTEPFEHEDLRVRFHPLGSSVEVPMAEGRIFAFVDQFLPDVSGLEVCRRLRCHPHAVKAHITLVLDHADVDAGKQAIKAGADDYVVGPMSRASILDRILGAISGSFEPVEPQLIELGELSIDLPAYQVRWRGAPIPLRPNEFRLLRFMVEHPGRVFTRFQLISALGKQDPPIDERTVDVWIGRLRRSLRAVGAVHRIRTVRNLGYVLDRP